MKITECKESQFKPFKIEIEIENEAEAKLLYQVFDHPHLKDALISRYIQLDDDVPELLKGIANNFVYNDRDKIVKIIRSHLRC